MLNRSASLAMSTRVLKAEPGKLDIKRHSPSSLGIRRTKNKETLIFLQELGVALKRKSQQMLRACIQNEPMRFPTKWYVRPTQPQISLRIRAV